MKKFLYKKREYNYMLLPWFVVFAVSLFFLIKSADYFIDAAKKIGSFFGMSNFFIGVTIVALGTSIPELATSIVSVFRNVPEIVAGNVIGSNIANILLIIGLIVVIKKNINIKKIETFEIFALLTSTLLFFSFSLNGLITIIESSVLFFLYSVYVLLLFFNREKNKQNEQRVWKWKNLFVLIFSATIIYFSAEFVIKSVVLISQIIGLGKEVVAVSAVAFGTSLPEIVVSLSALKKKSFVLAIGNIIGSNIFNSLIVIGVSGLFATLPVTNSLLSFALPLMLFATLFFLYLLKSQRIVLWHGIVFLTTYAYFLIRLF
jgi:cation:H+ antiporter